MINISKVKYTLFLKGVRESQTLGREHLRIEGVMQVSNSSERLLMHSALCLIKEKTTSEEKWHVY